MILFFLIILIIYLIFKVIKRFINNKDRKINKINVESFDETDGVNIVDEEYKIHRTIQINKPITYLVEENNINDEKYNNLPAIYSYMKKVKNVDDNKLITSKNSIYLTNAYKHYSTTNKKLEVITMIDDPNICIFFANSKKINLITNLFKDNLKVTLIPEISNININMNIGYLYDYELEIIRYILESCNVNIINSNIIFTKIKLTEIVDTLFILNTIDIFFYFNTGTCDILQKILENKYAIINYNNINLDKIKVNIPFSRIKSVVINKNFSITNIDQGGNNILLIDNLIYKKNIIDVLKEIQKYYSSDVVDVLNSYYKDYFTITTYAKELTKVKDIFKIENFSEQKILNLKYTLNTFTKHTIVEDIPNIDFNSNFKDITTQLYYKVYTTTDDNGIPLLKNDILNIINDITETLKSGNELEISGKYYIINVLFDSVIISKYKLVYEIDISDTLVLSKTNSNIESIKLNKKYELNNNDLVFIAGINKEGEYNNNNIKIFNDNSTDGDFKEKYICIEDSSITNQYICEGTKNISGTTKNKYTWDRVCVKNNECPFYLANKNYKNTKGKCINGYCELPLGIERKSFRRYEISENSYPICKGCSKEISLKDCCEIQKNDKNMKSPNYVFANDELNNMN
jgi:hypothetical protein